MQSSMYLLIFIASIILILVIVFVAHYRKNSHTELYREGVRNENDGQYAQALQNYEDALSEIRKLKLDNKFGIKIALRIKILRTFLDYEKSFQTNRPA
jgi:outer membrane protein assembly factor BamD (BamD/ComL family)